MNYIDYNESHLPVQLEGHKDPFSPKNVSLMIKQVISEEYHQNSILPTYGQVHKWDPRLEKKLKKRFPFFARLPKLLIALACGVTFNFMRTDKEDTLIEYIISRPINSISLEEMFRTSYRINNGDVYLTLLTIQNVLSRYWTDPNRSKRLVTTRLKDITNFNYRSDKFGAWYHMFGMILFGYSRGELRAKAVALQETFASKVLSGGKDEVQEDFINSNSGKIGARIKRFVKRHGYTRFKLNSKYLDEDFYMSLDEDFSSRLSGP
jgi:hypothetical protein